MPLAHKLRSGDQIEIITSSKQKPSREWLKFVVTTKAKSKIKDSLKEEKRTIAEEGKNILSRKLDHIGASMNQANFDELTSFYKLPSQLDLLYEIAIKKIDLKELKDFTLHGDKWFPPRFQSCRPKDKTETDPNPKHKKVQN